ncbi:MAG: S8 family serine peptidase [Helicobacter sp.]|nr:S8 family serine peptidase [Helicobacter sp.]
MHIKIPVLSIASCIALSSVYADTFENKHSHDIINTKAAWDSGINGKGVSIGIVDTVINKEHILLNNKILDQKIYKDNTTNREHTPVFTDCERQTCDTHGTHTAGIAIGKFEKTYQGGTNFFGVAYEAEAYSLGAIHSGGRKQPQPMALYDYFKDKKEVKVLNNSWGSNIYPLINSSLTETTTGEYILETSQETLKDNSPSTLLKTISTYWKGSVDCQTCNTTNEAELMRLASQKQVLSVFAAGNEGMVSPNIQSVLPRYDENLKAWISVGAFDPENVNKDQYGNLDFKNKNALATFSNAFYGAETWGILSPGVKINSANAAINDNYKQNSGTSMAAPFVSGAAALVAQKFPDLNGRQIADVLLSTANKNIKLPNVIVKDTYNKKYTIIFIDDGADKKGLVTKDKQEIIRQLKNAGYTSDADKIVANIMKTPEGRDSVYVLGKESVIGQGVLDIQKALKGIAVLDANRLTQGDIYTLTENDTKLVEWDFQKAKQDPTKFKFSENEHALYTLSVSQDKEMLFSNDIGQRKWDKSLHFDKGNLESSPSQLANPMTYFDGVGLLKKGDGKLVLSGQNTYTGLTFIESGTLALMSQSEYDTLKNHDASKNNPLIPSTLSVQANAINTGIEQKAEVTNKPSLAGSVLVAQNGTLSGSGRIGQNLDNQGNVQAGNLIPASGVGGENNNLEVGGTYTQRKNASLSLVFGESANAKLIASGYKIEGGSLKFIPQKNTFFNINGDKKINIDLGDMPMHSFANVETNQQNTSLRFLFDVKTSAITPVLSTQAYMTNNTTSSFTNALKTVRAKQDLSQNYKDFFGELDSMTLSSAVYKDSIEQVQGGAHLLATNEVLNIQKRMLNEFYNLPTQNSIAPLASITGGSYQAYNAGSKMTFVSDQKDTFVWKGLFNVGYLNTNNKLLHLNSGYIGSSLGLNASFGNLESFAGANLAFGQNSYTGQISQFAVKGSYTDIILGAQTGVRYNFHLTSTFTLSPLAYLSFTHIHTTAFKEKSLIFAKSFGASGQNMLGANIGFALNIALKNGLRFDVLSVYENILNANTLSANARFVDFDESFNILKPLTAQSLRSAINMGFVHDSPKSDSKVTLGVFHAVTNQTNSIGVQLGFLLRFGEKSAQESQESDSDL